MYLDMRYTAWGHATKSDRLAVGVGLHGKHAHYSFFLKGEKCLREGRIEKSGRTVRIRVDHAELEEARM